MGRVYSLIGENLTLGTGSVLAALQTAAAATTAGGVLAIRRCEISQSGSTTSALVRAALSKRDTAGTLTVTGATPSPLSVGGAASGITSGTSPLTAAKCGVASSADSGGTYTDIWYTAPHVFNGAQWLFTPPETIYLPPSTVFCVRMMTAPASLTGWDVVVVFEELW